MPFCVRFRHFLIVLFFLISVFFLSLGKCVQFGNLLLQVSSSFEFLICCIIVSSEVQNVSNSSGMVLLLLLIK